MTVEALAKTGGVFSVLAFVHFLIDWGLQTHQEAVNKSKNWRIRARHCLVYAAGFLPVFWLLGLSAGFSAMLFAILWVSHFIEDTYWPVFLWVKYVRRPPSLDTVEFVKTPLGLILVIAMDQIIHLAFVLLCAALIVLR